MKTMTRQVVAAAAALVLCGGSARGDEDWRGRFDGICSRTADAASMSPQELEKLVAASDLLLKQLEGLEPTERKVFTKRLGMCRELYRFMLENRQGGGSSGEPRR